MTESQAFAPPSQSGFKCLAEFPQPRLSQVLGLPRDGEVRAGGGVGRPGGLQVAPAPRTLPPRRAQPGLGRRPQGPAGDPGSRGGAAFWAR